MNKMHSYKAKLTSSHSGTYRCSENKPACIHSIHAYKVTQETFTNSISLGHIHSNRKLFYLGLRGPNSFLSPTTSKVYAWFCACFLPWFP
jgi:hypothetical protein